jgi:glycosyltransferase involved in cell wall biosynthesis
MKIIYLANVRLPTEKAHGLQIMKMCQAFAILGHEVELVVPRRLNNLPQDPFAYYGLPGNFKIVKLPCLDLILWDKILGNLSFWLASASFFISCKIFLLFRKYDIVYTREEQFISFLKLSFLELHSLPEKIRFYHRFFWRRFKRIVVLTSFIKTALIDSGIAAAKISVAPDGVDLAEFDLDVSQGEARQKLNLPSDKKLAVYTGHLYDWKGAQTIADAAKYLPADAQVVFVGGTAEDVEKFKEKNNNIENIIIAGHQPHSQIPLYLKAADVLVLPNSGKEKISQFYTSPLKMFEYMASGVPIVASDLPALREILNENNSVLVEPDNPGALAEGIKMILADNQQAQKISHQSLAEAQNYSWLKRAERIINFIKH